MSSQSSGPWGPHRARWKHCSCQMARTSMWDSPAGVGLRVRCSLTCGRATRQWKDGDRSSVGRAAENPLPITRPGTGRRQWVID